MHARVLDNKARPVRVCGCVFVRVFFSAGHGVDCVLQLNKYYFTPMDTNLRLFDVRVCVGREMVCTHTCVGHAAGTTHTGIGWVTQLLHAHT
jgi:hypothetical protein